MQSLKQAGYDRLDIIRVYAKPPGKVHRDFLHALQSARIWGEGVYDGPPASRDHVLHDGDVVELRT